MYLFFNVTENPFNGLNIPDEAHLVFTDIDGDGDMDMFVGHNYGGINYYKNNDTPVNHSSNDEADDEPGDGPGNGPTDEPGDNGSSGGGCFISIL